MASMLKDARSSMYGNCMSLLSSSTAISKVHVSTGGHGIRDGVPEYEWLCLGTPGAGVASVARTRDVDYENLNFELFSKPDFHFMRKFAPSKISR